MSSSVNEKQRGEHLHHRLLAGDLIVTNEIAEQFLPVLIRFLQHNFPNLPDTHLISVAAGDALLNLFSHPERFDPERATLQTYLKVRARTYLLNRLAERKDIPDEYKIVELDDQDAVYANEIEDHSTSAKVVLGKVFHSEIMARLKQFLADDRDLRVIELMIDGERETAVFADALGIADLSSTEQKRLVKRAKDRLKKVLERTFKQRGKRP